MTNTNQNCPTRMTNLKNLRSLKNGHLTKYGHISEQFNKRFFGQYNCDLYTITTTELPR